jgi:hypothetical protein
MAWNTVVEKITPYIVKIETPQGHGTGFLCLYNESRGMCGIATAHHVVAHVVAHAEQWQEPIRIRHSPSDKPAFLTEADRVILIDDPRDSAVILFHPRKLELPEQLIPLLPLTTRLPIGADIGWLGYPSIDPQTLCFFSGSVSAWHDARRAYLIDGVAINGVSGGPVVYSTPADGVQIVGSISAYMANRATGGTLPGLCVAQDVSHFHDIAAFVKSLDDAKREKQKIEADKPALEQPPQVREPPNIPS